MYKIISRREMGFLAQRQWRHMVVKEWTKNSWKSKYDRDAHGGETNDESVARLRWTPCLVQCALREETNGERVALFSSRWCRAWWETRGGKETRFWTPRSMMKAVMRRSLIGARDTNECAWGGADRAGHVRSTSLILRQDRCKRHDVFAHAQSFRGV
jgi:hypothetical protein